MHLRFLTKECARSCQYLMGLFCFLLAILFLLFETIWADWCSLSGVDLLYIVCL